MGSDYLVKLKNLSPPKAVKIQNAPERIFLCLGDYSLGWRKENFGDLEEVTWCEDEATDITIQFIRADIHEETKKQLRALEDAVRSWDENPTSLRRPEILKAIQNSRARKQG